MECQWKNTIQLERMEFNDWMDCNSDSYIADNRNN